MEVAAAKQLLPMARGPNSPSSSTSSSSPSSAAASPSPRQQSHSHAPVPPPPPSPRPVPRIIDTTPFPTTFVQADTASFKQVVQRLTGSDTPPPPPHKPAKSHGHGHGHNHHHGGGGGLAGGPKKPAFKLYERRIGKSNLKMIAPLAMAAAAAAGAAPEALSPSVLDFPSLALRSPVTPLLADPFNRSPASASASASQGEEDEAAERAAIARNGFFLHPSPRGAEPPPRLLPLFPVTSPRMAAPSPLQ